MNKVLIITVSLLLALTMIACNQKAASNGAVIQPGEHVEVGGAQTPTDAYTMLYKAVKAKQIDAIKKMMSQKTLGFAEGVAGQQKKPVEQIFENGFTATTFAATMPQIRDERVKDDMGALEVYNDKDKRWEDLPFIKEADGWKLAIGDIFAGTYKKPAKGQAEIEAEASNTNNMIPLDNSTNPTINSNVKIQKPMQGQPPKPMIPTNQPPMMPPANQPPAPPQK